jgi:hypothetical protein
MSYSKEIDSLKNLIENLELKQKQEVEEQKSPFRVLKQHIKIKENEKKKWEEEILKPAIKYNNQWLSMPHSKQPPPLPKEGWTAQIEYDNCILEYFQTQSLQIHTLLQRIEKLETQLNLKKE